MTILELVRKNFKGRINSNYMLFFLWTKEGSKIMDLFERIQNIKNINYEKELQNTIIMVKEELKNIIIWV